MKKIKYTNEPMEMGERLPDDFLPPPEELRKRMKKDKTVREFRKALITAILAGGPRTTEQITSELNAILKVVAPILEQAKSEGEERLVLALLQLPLRIEERIWLSGKLEEAILSASNGKKARPKTTPSRKDRDL